MDALRSRLVSGEPFYQQERLEDAEDLKMLKEMRSKPLKFRKLEDFQGARHGHEVFLERAAERDLKALRGLFTIESFPPKTLSQTHDLPDARKSQGRVAIDVTA